VQSREVAIDRSSDGTVVRVTTVAQGVALALGRALYGPGFRPDQVFPMAERLPVPRSTNGHAGGNGHAAADPAPVARDMTSDDAAASGNAASPASGPETPSMDVQQPLLTFAGVCPDCGASLAYENGCSHCRACGYSRC